MDADTYTGGTTTPPPPAPPACQSAAALLDKISAEIRDFEARKLTELKTQLEAFVKKQTGLVEQYKGKYDELKRRWCAQNADIVTLAAQLKTTHDPTSDQWKELVAKCICAQQRNVRCLGEHVTRRKRCGTGARERAKDLAKAKTDIAKEELDTLVALVSKLEAAMTDHGKWITQIANLPGPERVTALYLFWFKLLPSHRAIMPETLPSDCKVPGEDITPAIICKTTWDKKCDPEPGACSPQKDDPELPTPAGPRILDPKNYEGALDCAWDAYRKRKDELAVAEEEFKKDPDDLTAITKRHTTKKESLEADILACLKEWKAPDPCCTGTAEPTATERGA